MGDFSGCSEKELSQLLVSGDKRVFDFIFEKYYPTLFGFSSQFLDSDSAEDVVQETMLWLWVNVEYIDPNRSLKSLLFTIVKNRCFNFIDHRKIRDRVHTKILENECYIDDEDVIFGNDLREKLELELDRMNLEYSESFRLNRFNNLSYDEIAKLKSVSSKTVAYRISKALSILKDKLKDYIISVFI